MSTVRHFLFHLPVKSSDSASPLSPEYKISIPDLSKVQPILIGPITDLLTFYVDLRLAMKEKGLVRAGDHAYVRYGVPSSWADGMYTVLGQSAIDFDITLQAIDPKTQVATLVVRHVPPPQIEGEAARRLDAGAGGQGAQQLGPDSKGARRQVCCGGGPGDVTMLTSNFRWPQGRSSPQRWTTLSR